DPARGHRDDPPGRGRTVAPPRGPGPQGREEDRPAGARAHRPEVPPVRRHDPRGVVRRLVPPVLPDLPDGRQAPGRPPPVPPPQVAGPRGTRRPPAASAGSGPGAAPGPGMGVGREPLVQFGSGTSGKRGATLVQRLSWQPSSRVKRVSIFLPFQVPLTVATSGPP